MEAGAEPQRLRPQNLARGRARRRAPACGRACSGLGEAWAGRTWCEVRFATAAAELAGQPRLQASLARTSSRNMFSALKKLVGSEQAPGRDKNIPAGLQSMNQALQRRFAKGVQYNSECGPRRRAGRGGWQGPGRPPSLRGSGRTRG